MTQAFFSRAYPIVPFVWQLPALQVSSLRILPRAAAAVAATAAAAAATAVAAVAVATATAGRMHELISE